MSIFKFFSKKGKKEESKEPKKESGFAFSIKKIFTHKKIDENFLEELEDLLISNDIGAKTSSEIIDFFRKEKFAKNIDENEIKEILAQKITKILEPCQKSLENSLNQEKKPKIITFNGVNGAGKTTTIGKIAHNLTNQGNKVLIAACDTFRAAASSQLETWAKRSNSELISAQKENEDPAAVAYRALQKAKAENFDFLLIDTAGRLQNKKNLMEELQKINRVLKKIDENAPDQNLLILDGTTGQNAKNQVEIFDQIIKIDGLIITKLDGSAKGGIIVAIAKEHQKPIYAIGIGEKIEDLQDFNAQEYANNLIGI